MCLCSVWPERLFQSFGWSIFRPTVLTVERNPCPATCVFLMEEEARKIGPTSKRNKTSTEVFCFCLWLCWLSEGHRSWVVCVSFCGQRGNWKSWLAQGGCMCHRVSGATHGFAVCPVYAPWPQGQVANKVKTELLFLTSHKGTRLLASTKVWCFAWQMLLLVGARMQESGVLGRSGQNLRLLIS